jgi:prepilin peptidase CpaA
MLFWLLDVVLRAVAILLLGRVGVTDFFSRKIANIHLLQLLALALAIQVADSEMTRGVESAMYSLLVGAALFVALFVFWLAGKVGAGDVKLLGIVPLLVGEKGMWAFMISFMIATYATYFVTKYPIVLPERWFRRHIEEMAKMGRVPFGVPITAAAIVATLWSAATPF